MEQFQLRPTKAQLQEWSEAVSWSDILNWHKKYTPWLKDLQLIKQQYERVLEQTNYEISVVNPQLKEQVQLKEKEDIESNNVIKQKLAELEQQQKKQEEVQKLQVQQQQLEVEIQKDTTIIQEENKDQFTKTNLFE